MHSEVVPLGVHESSVVVLEVQIVFVIVDFYGLAEVAAFKSALKDKCVIRVPALFELVIRLQIFVVSVQSWPLFFGGRPLLAKRSYVSAVCVRLLEAVWQVVWIEVVTLLVGLVYGSFSRLVNRRQLNKLALVNVKVVDGPVILR